MLNLQKFARWMSGWLDDSSVYDLPEDVYNDVIPSGVHHFNHMMNT